jgi:hypothetical protein
MNGNRDLALVVYTGPVAERMDEPISPDLFVPSRQLTRYEIAAFQDALDESRVESDMQSFLEAVPQFLIHQFAVGRGAWVVPKKRLGSEHETDFLIADEASGGLMWHAVELERPQAMLFTRKGDPSAALNHAIRQIMDWREWLSQNRDYASKPRAQSGLGLTGINPELDGLIIIGRGTDGDEGITARRRRLAGTHRVQIETYDWLLSQARGRLEAAQPDLARAASEVARWQEMSGLTDEPLPGPVREVHLSNIDPAEYSKSNLYTFRRASEITDEIPAKFSEFITKVHQILQETGSTLNASYDKVGDYVILIASGYITGAQSEKIDQFGKKSPVRYLLTALVYSP